MADVSISGAECVKALRTAGFWVANHGPDATLLKRGGRIVVVPHVLVLAEEVLDGILEAANLTENGFLSLLAEAPTMPDLRCVLPSQTGSA
jgi:hypothetical protein